MTPQHASQSHGQVRRTGIETNAAAFVQGFVQKGGQ